MPVWHFPCHGGGTGGGADLGGGIEVSEGGSAFGELIKVGSLNFRVAGESKVTVAEIVGDDDNDVGPFDPAEKESGEEKERENLDHSGNVSLLNLIGCSMRFFPLPLKTLRERDFFFQSISMSPALSS